MIRLITLLFSILFVNYSEGQMNLVPDSSFELYSDCPEGIDLFVLPSTYWYRPIINTSGNIATSDLFNVCSTSTLFDCVEGSSADVPKNVVGFQYPRSGNGYGGLVNYHLFFIGTYKEYLATPLLQTLEGGKEYCVQFYASKADSAIYGSENLYAFFSADSLIQNSIETVSTNSYVLHNNFQIENVDEWVKVSGNYVAQGFEKYLVIGGIEEFDTVQIFNSGMTSACTGYYGAYYYLDDVSVCEKVDNVCRCSQNGSEEPDIEISSNDSYFLPNVLTPNGDHANDVWTTNFISDDEYVIILNRWGNEMIKLNINSPIWDGNVNGKISADGTYFYVAYLRGETKHGFISLLK